MTKLSFDKKKRLLTAQEFNQVFTKNQSVIRKTRFMLLAKLNFLSHPRLGVVIAKKKVKRAVVRNRIRRVIKEIFRLQQNRLEHKDFVILVRNNICKEEAWKQELTTELTELFSGLFKPINMP